MQGHVFAHTACYEIDLVMKPYMQFTYMSMSTLGNHVFFETAYIIVLARTVKGENNVM